MGVSVKWWGCDTSYDRDETSNLEGFRKFGGAELTVIGWKNCVWLCYPGGKQHSSLVLTWELFGKNIRRLFRKHSRPLLAEELHLSQETSLKGSVNKTVVLPLSPARWWGCYLYCSDSKCPCSKFWIPSLPPNDTFLTLLSQDKAGLDRARIAKSRTAVSQWEMGTEGKNKEKAEEGKTCTHWEPGTEQYLQAGGLFFR